MTSAVEQPASQPPHSPPAESNPDYVEAEFHEDPVLDQSSLPRAVKARRAEYTRPHSIRVKVGSWNVAAIPGTEEDVGTWFVQHKGTCEQLSGLKVSDSSDGSGAKLHVSKARPPTQPEPETEYVDLYVLGLQEIVDVSSPTETLRPYVDPVPANKWKSAVQDALPPGYQLIAETQLVGLLQLIYASPSTADSISSVSCTSVGTGLLGYMGNKGAVVTRLTLGETTCLVFVNCHLAAGSDKGSLDRRNWDASQIAARAKFDPLDVERGLRDDPSESIGKEDFTFWFGDLNYRLEDIPGDDVRQVLARHTENAYDHGHTSFHEVHDGPDSPQVVVDEDSKNPTPSVVDDTEIDPLSDPASLQTTIASLIPHDQLRLQQKKQKAFHEGWREGDITFLPTYKYDVGSVAQFDSSEKHRGPSWCDRILFRTRNDILQHKKQLKEAEDARKRDAEMIAQGVDKAVADDSVLFDYDPDVDGAENGDEYDPTKDQSDDDDSLFSQPPADTESLQLDYYVSYQGILSSDHKPLAAGFTLSFDSVDPQLKSKVHQEVVRELDKAENESRPGLTVVVDNHGVLPRDERSRNDPNAIDFGNIAYNVPTTRTVVVANTSGAPASFSFENPNTNPGEAQLPSWIDYHIDSPSDRTQEGPKNKGPSHEYTLSPGELANIEITAHVRSIELVRLLNDGRMKLEEILILRVTSGRDHFIPASGTWLPTCFGRSLDELTLMPETGARTLPPTNLSDRRKSDTGMPSSAPRELFRLTEAISELTERAVAEWSMTRGESEDETPPWNKEPHGFGWPFDSETWTLKDEQERRSLLACAREALDTNQLFNTSFAPEVPSLHRLEILSETLMLFLHSLSDGIVTAPVWKELEAQLIAQEKSKSPPQPWEESQAWVLENLAYSPAHSVSFTFVTFMLARIVNEVAPSPATLKRAPSQTPQDQQNNPDTADPPQSPTQPSKSATTTPTSPPSKFISGGSFRRRARTLTSSSSSTPPDPTLQAPATRRAAVESTLATLFAKYLISTDASGPSKDKERRALEDRQRRVIEPFLKTIGVDNNGPSGGG